MDSVSNSKIGSGPLVLLADDKESARQLIATELQEAGCEVVEAVDGEDAWARFQRHSFDLVVTDLRMPRSDGMGLLRRICGPESVEPQVPVLLVSAFGDLSTATEAGRVGAADFFPFNDSGIEGLVNRAVEILDRRKVPLPISLLGESREAVHLRERVEAFAPLSEPLLVWGDPGSRRESVARYIHRKSPYSRLPFVEVTWTEAASVLPRVREGTVFLAGFDCLDFSDQMRWVDRVRDSEGERSAPFRLLASTDTSPDTLSAAGRLNRESLRTLARFRIELPPLSNRTSDIPAMIDELHRRAQRRSGRASSSYTADALEAMRSYRWRQLDELEATVERVLACARGGTITIDVVADALTELEGPLERIDQERRRAERELLIELYRKHGTYSGVARELGITRNAAKYRLGKHDLLPGRIRG